jgi:hypothetical protein
MPILSQYAPNARAGCKGPKPCAGPFETPRLTHSEAESSFDSAGTKISELVLTDSPVPYPPANCPNLRAQPKERCALALSSTLWENSPFNGSTVRLPPLVGRDAFDRTEIASRQGDVSPRRSVDIPKTAYLYNSRSQSNRRLSKTSRPI